MKEYILVFFRIRQCFLVEKLIFSLFILGNLICTLTLIFSYGNMLSFKRYTAQNYFLLRTYTITFSRQVDLDYLDLSPLTKQDTQTENIWAEIAFSCPIEPKEFHGLDGTQVKNLWNRATPDCPIQIVSYYSHENILNASLGRVEFTAHELNSGQTVAIAPGQIIKSADLNQSVSLRDVPFTLIGASAFPDRFIIPITTYRNLDLPVRQISLLASQIFSPSAEKQVLESLEINFPNAIIMDTTQIRRKLDISMWQELPGIGLIYLCSLLSFLYLLRYMMERNSYSNVIYSIVGASKKRVIKILYLEIISLILLINLVGVFIHTTFYEILFSHLNMLDGIVYNNLDYILVLLISIIISGIITWPFIWKFRQLSIITYKNISSGN